MKLRQPRRLTNSLVARPSWLRDHCGASTTRAITRTNSFDPYPV